jgi:hypothetical protein
MTIPTALACVSGGQEPQYFAEVEKVRLALAARELKEQASAESRSLVERWRNGVGERIHRGMQ